LVSRQTAGRARAWEEHAQITAFVLAGDAIAAADVVSRHLARAGNDLHRRLGGADPVRD
jgi:DNA-binding FadR family transcriptional regulator